jgi:hypothetical protein
MMSIEATFGLVLASLLVGLALWPAWRARSWKRFLIAAFLSAVGVLLPFLVFLLSSALVPDWKGGCRLGWLDCFHEGKIILTPLVLWACVAFYVVQILKPPDRYQRCIVLGLFTGAIVSSVCFVFGVVLHASDQAGVRWWLLVPFYTAVWYWVLCGRAIRASTVGVGAYVLTLFGSVPFWLLSVIRSRQCYLSLPGEPPDCFVVTATLRGHEWIVGPLERVDRGGVPRQANRQLLTFWTLEALWQDRCPMTHRVFRGVYNGPGPVVSRRIRTRVRADVVYLALKPCEWVARLIVRRHRRAETAERSKGDEPMT